MDRYFEDCRKDKENVLIIEKKLKSIHFVMESHDTRSLVCLSYEETKELIKHLQTLMEEEKE